MGGGAESRKLPDQARGNIRGQTVVVERRSRSFCRTRGWARAQRSRCGNQGSYSHVSWEGVPVRRRRRRGCLRDLQIPRVGVTGLFPLTPSSPRRRDLPAIVVGALRASVLDLGRMPAASKTNSIRFLAIYRLLLSQIRASVRGGIRRGVPLALSGLEFIEVDTDGSNRQRVGYVFYWDFHNFNRRLLSRLVFGIHIQSSNLPHLGCTSKLDACNPEI